MNMAVRDWTSSVVQRPPAATMDQIEAVVDVRIVQELYERIKEWNLTAVCDYGVQQGVFPSLAYAKRLAAEFLKYAALSVAYPAVATPIMGTPVDALWHLALEFSRDSDRMRQVLGGFHHEPVVSLEDSRWYRPRDMGMMLYQAAFGEPPSDIWCNFASVPDCYGTDDTDSTGDDGTYESGDTDYDTGTDQDTGTDGGSDND